MINNYMKLKIPLLRRIFILFISFHISFILSGPSINDGADWFKLILDKFDHECSINTNQIKAVPYSYSRVYNQLLFKDFDSEFCNSESKKIIKYIDENFLEKRNVIGMQLGSSSYNFASLGRRFNDSSNLFLERNGYNKNIAYVLRATSIDNDIRFDESYISYYTSSNKIITFGRVSNWWGPSEETSLILSNQARPVTGFTFENNISTAIKYLNFLGPTNYKFFIGTLKNDSYINDAKLLGARYSFFPSKKFNFSFSRTAQFGGEGRPEDLRSLINVIIGRDNFGDDGISIQNEPSNQLAAIDFVYKPFSKPNLKIFSQIAGEDESGYLPSRTFYNIGIKYQNNKVNPYSISIEYTDTFSSSKIENYTYSHNVYKGGYRYSGKPIGASIDADSDILILSYNKILMNGDFLKLKIFDAYINKNNNENNFWHQSQLKLKGYQMSYVKEISSRFLIDANFNYFQSSIESKNSSDFFIKLVYKF